MFQTNPLGAMRESAVVDEVNNESWNTIWDVRTGQYEWGWGVRDGDPVQVAALSAAPDRRRGASTCGA